MQNFLAKAKASMPIIATLDGKTKNRILNEMADALLDNSNYIVKENRKDMQEGVRRKLEASLLDRLLLDAKRLEGVAQSLRDIAGLKEPIGRVLEGWVQEDNIRIEKVSVPIGVVGVI
jgi:glutamate-5-semialdehyde dehydrogenase